MTLTEQTAEHLSRHLSRLEAVEHGMRARAARCRSIGEALLPLQRDEHVRLQIQRANATDRELGELADILADIRAAVSMLTEPGMEDTQPLGLRRAPVLPTDPEDDLVRRRTPPRR